MQIARRFVRWDINRQAKVTLSAAEKSVECTLKDISFMGCRVTLPVKLPKDEFVKFMAQP